MTASYLLEASDISVAVPVPHGADLAVVKDAGIEIEAGVSYSIQGKSGSGKTSLLSVLGLLNTSYEGSLLFHGDEVRNLSDGRLSLERARHVGFVFQTYSLVPHLNAFDNVMLPALHARHSRSTAASQARRALASVGLESRAADRPAQLSGGEQQRVAIARAIVNGPSVVMADEPTGALDTATADDVMRILMKSVDDDGIALVMVTHDDDIAALCARHYTMADGRLAETALPDPDIGQPGGANSRVVA